MKKVLIGLLMVIPLLIVGAVLLITEVVLLTPDIAVTGVEIVDEYQVPVENVEVDNFSYGIQAQQLYAKVIPSKANNKNVKWKIDNASFFNSDYEGEIATVNESGVVTIYSTGSFDVVLTTDDGGFEARCSFLVKSDVATSGYIVYQGKKASELGEINIKTDSTAKLDACARPTDVDIEMLRWEVVSGKDVVSVDANGIVTPKKAGTAVVKMDIKSFDKKDKNGAVVKRAPVISDEITINVSAGEFKVPYYFTVASTVSLSELGAEGATLTSADECTAADGKLNFSSSKGYAVLTKNGKSITVWKYTDGDILYENFDALKEYTVNRAVIIGKIPYTLNCIDAATGEKAEKVHYLSSDTTVATVDENGKINALSEGTVTISATSGGSTCVITLTVKEPVIYFKLATDTKLGIARERVFGTKWYNADGDLISTREKLKILQPANIDNTRFIWTCDNTDVCSIDETGAISLTDFDGERVITITIVAKESPYTNDSVKSSYTFTVRKGINVVSGVELAKAADLKTDDVFLQKDITFYDTNNSWHVNLHTSLYGNGQLVNWRNSEGDEKNNLEGADIIIMYGKDTLIRNVKIQSSTPPADGSFSSKSFGHKCLEIVGDNITVQYSQFEYAQFCVQVSDVNSKFDGCLFSNSSKFSLFSWCCYENQHCIVKNCIFGISAAPSIGFSCGDANAANTCNLEIQGFCKIYNWKESYSMDLIGSITGDETLDNAIKQIVNNELGNSRYDSYCYFNNGVRYMHCGIMLSGFQQECRIKLTGDIEENGYKCLTIDFNVIADGSIAMLFGSDLHNCYIYGYGGDSVPIRPLKDTYTLNDETCKMLREGEPEKTK